MNEMHIRALAVMSLAVLGWVAASVAEAAPIAVIRDGAALHPGIVETHEGCGPAGIEPAGVGGGTPACVPNGQRQRRLEPSGRLRPGAQSKEPVRALRHRSRPSKPAASLSSMSASRRRRPAWGALLGAVSRDRGITVKDQAGGRPVDEQPAALIRDATFRCSDAAALIDDDPFSADRA